VLGEGSEFETLLYTHAFSLSPSLPLSLPLLTSLSLSFPPSLLSLSNTYTHKRDTHTKYSLCTSLTLHFTHSALSDARLKGKN
jgi:hypothetical protein